MKNPIVQKVIIEELGVKPVINVEEEVEGRVSLLAHYLRSAGAVNYVLGISGGIDSTAAGRLVQLAVQKLRGENYPCNFIAVRLPCGEQRDEDDAQLALAFIQADQTVTMNIARASEAMLFELTCTDVVMTAAHQDFVMGNIKARQRMVAQYAIAGAVNGLVVGTDHASEAVMGFFTKFGDGAADICPLAGLTKDQVRQVAEHLGAPEKLVSKVPTADLEELNPGKPDEEAFGFPYDHVNMYLKGMEVPEDSELKIMEAYIKTMHKRQLPVTP